MHGGPPLPTSDRSETLFCIVGWCYMLLRCFLFWKLNEACVRALVDLNFHVRGAGPKPLKSSGVHERASPSPPRVLDRPRRPRAHGKVHQSSHGFSKMETAWCNAVLKYDPAVLPTVVFLKMVQIIIRIVALFDSPKGRALETATKFRLRNFELF